VEVVLHVAFAPRSMGLFALAGTGMDLETEPNEDHYGLLTSFSKLIRRH
jgi:hypothetical protein